MTRESRLIVTLLVMSGIGVFGLMLVANQYRKSLPNPGTGRPAGDEASIRAVRLVDGYLAARSAVKEDLGKKLNSKVLTAHGMTYEDYARVRAAWRNYRSGVIVDDHALVAAFRARRAQLENADLGPIEALDDAIR